MPAGIQVNVDNVWHKVNKVHVNVNGSWRECQNVYINVNDTWKPMYSYRYVTGAWGWNGVVGGCSKSCGGGDQNRTVYCERTYGDGLSHQVDNSYCKRAGLGDPPSSYQSNVCNTHSCVECHDYEVEKYSWRKIIKKVAGIVVSCSFIIYWNGEQVYHVGGDECLDVDVSIPRTISGYTYTKYDTGAEYLGVCRTPV